MKKQEHGPEGPAPEDDAMTDDIRSFGDERGALGREAIEEGIRARVRGVIEAIVQEELESVLGASRSERTARRGGYRHGRRPRELTTSVGKASFSMPRARIRGEGGESREWRSRVVERYQRRTARVDEAILGVYLTGTNTRRLKGALSPLVRGGPLSKDSVSRLVGRLAEDFESWRQRDLSGDGIVYLVMDGWYPKVRIGKRRVRVPVLVTMGVKSSGERIVVDVRLSGQESAAAWGEVVESLSQRNIRVPLLAIIDGNPGAEAALRRQWAGIAIQRCTVHKLRNLEAKAPASLREELKEDYRRMIYGESAAAVEKARHAFTKKWRLRCPPVARSFEEASEELFTFLRFPRSQWKALRTTNALERINEEFRRRTKTQASLPTADAVLLLLFGLLRSGLVHLRAIDGCKDMPAHASQQQVA